jgi:hypothetical protein
MSRRIRNANPVTLFPFLAVLMCTIGALVLLLVVISAQIRGTTVQQFVAERQKVAEPARPIELPPVSVEESGAEPVSDLEPIRVESIVGEVTEPRPVDPLEPPVARIPPPVPASDEQLAAIEALKSQAAALKAKYSDAVEELGGLSQKRSALDRQLKAVVAQACGVECREPPDHRTAGTVGRVNQVGTPTRVDAAAFVDSVRRPDGDDPQADRHRMRRGSDSL